jgi:hypothetical protein
LAQAFVSTLRTGVAGLAGGLGLACLLAGSRRWLPGAAFFICQKTAFIDCSIQMRQRKSD